MSSLRTPQDGADSRPAEPADEPARVTTGARKDLDLGSLRERLSEQRGQRLWRSLQEASNSPEFERMVGREFPDHAATWGEDDGVSRRRFLQLMSASLALGGVTACTRQPLEKIVPYVDMPEQIVPGKPLYYATSMDLDGYALGLLAESHMGRPTKLEGNPEHPASQGATDVYAQASILDLYDPARAENVTQLGRIRTWQAFADEIAGVLEAQRALAGAGLRILSGTITSPTLAALRSRILEELPEARWHQYEPVGNHTLRAGIEAAFGQPLGLRYDFRSASVVVTLDSNFLAEGPGSVRYARDFFARRQVRGGHHHRINRLYSVESTPTPTGTMADHRVAVSSVEVGQLTVALAAKLGVPGVSGGTAPSHSEVVDAMVADLRAHPGESVVVAGREVSADVHAVVHAINSTLGNIGTTVHLTQPIEAATEDQLASIGELTRDMSAGAVDTILVLEGNPVYDAPADLDFLDAYLKVPRRVHLAHFENETAEYSHWNLPAAHYLESWGDSRAYDGTVTLRQPLIEPLYGGKCALEVVSMLTPEGGRDGDDLLKEHWVAQREAAGTDFSRTWRKWLHDGMIESTAAAPAEVALRSVGGPAQRLTAATAPRVDEPEILFRADPCVYDGRFNNNAWLQELPKPLTKLTWDNAALVSPALAEEKGLANEDLVQIEVDGRSLEVPVWIHPGQAPYSITISLGYGRVRTGPVGEGTGFNAYALRGSATPWTAAGARLAKTGGRYPLASTQLHSNMELEGEAAEERHLVRVGTIAEFDAHPEFAQHVGHGDDSLTLMAPYEYDGHAWGLSVDLSSCMGCNACVVACQSENNIPVVGKEQVSNGREMHWLRIDRYYDGDLDDPQMHHQPVMCMHCEQAPCEVVCPVSATVHSEEGLNDMVYNRCVGTRYCSNNCPYKVRRFNFFKYNDTDTPVLKMLRNPDVTVRTRGVMEKCSYCVQRINQARNTAKVEDRSIRDGEIQTACEQACPAGAIRFGDINDPESKVAQAKSEPLDYGILTELGTRPRTTYLAKLRNPNPELSPASTHGGGHADHEASAEVNDGH